MIAAALAPSLECRHEALGRRPSFRLERRLEALSGESRHERTRCWQDTARLTKEFRTWFKQYQDLVQRSRILKPQPKD